MINSNINNSKSKIKGYDKKQGSRVLEMEKGKKGEQSKWSRHIFPKLNVVMYLNHIQKNEQEQLSEHHLFESE